MKTSTIQFQCHAALIENVDMVRGHLSRSAFIRQAIAEKLRAMGIDVSEAEAGAPSRIGKGGPNPHGMRWLVE